MPHAVYPWRRFWYPRGGQISLADAGFLVDPESEYARYHPQDVVPFDAIAHSPCLVLLGEPGIGKSTALKADFEATKAAAHANGDEALFFDLRDYSSDERLERKVFKSDAVQAWLAGPRTLHLFLDSLDEGLLRIDNISRVILAELTALPAERLRLRIASRPADWQGSLEEGFRTCWNTHDVSVFTLAPLRRKDAASAASIAGLDAATFVTALIRAEVVPLAIKPVTLDLLITTFLKDGALPIRRTDLYFEGCHRLCEEPSPTRTESPRARPRLSAGQRMAIASRLAALSQFSNHSSFWNGAHADMEPQDIATATAIGGTEAFNETEVTVDLNGVREVFDTGLFLSPDLNRQGWRHQTYAEYLAAFYLQSNKVTLDRLRTLFLHPDGSNKVIPQLRETATWLTALNPEFFRLIARFDPEVVLRSDMASASPADRADLARQLLRSFGEGGILESLRNMHGSLERLDNPELPTLVRPYLSDKVQPKDSRIAAIEIVGACKLTECEPEIITILSDVTEHVSVRKRAISVVDELGSQTAYAALRPLAFGQSGDDLNDDLKGYALNALWPDRLSATDLFDHLPGPQKLDYLGPYWRFLGSDIAKSLHAGDMPCALAWARQHSAGHNQSNVLHKLATAILERAVDYIDEPGVVELLAGALMERIRRFSDVERIAKKLGASPDRGRRALTHALIQNARGFAHGAFAVIDLCSIDAADAPWLLDKLSHAMDEDDRRLIAELIARRLDRVSVADFDAILYVASRDIALEIAIAPLITAIELDSPLAARLRAEHAQWAARQQPQVTSSPVPLDQALVSALTNTDTAAYFQVHFLLYEHNNQPHHQNDSVPRWSELNPTIQSEVLMAARKYLKTRPPAPTGAWWKNGRFSFGMIAGSSALHLLAVASPPSLDVLSDEDWGFWTPMVVAYSGDQQSGHAIVLAKAYERAKATFTRTLEEVVEGENTRFGQIMVLRNIDPVWSDELAELLRARIAGLKPKAFKDVLSVLLAKGDLPTKELALDMVKAQVPATGDDRQRTIFAAVELLAHYQEQWKTLWPVFQGDSALGVEVLAVTAYEHEYSSFAMSLPPSDVSNLCIWLASMGLEKEEPNPQNHGLVTPPVALAQWWNILINSLSESGTREACRALEHMIDALPQYQDGLRNSLRRAQELMRRISWEAPSPRDVLDIAKCCRMPRLVISVHGIRTRGAWQKQINSDLQKAGFRHELLDYGYFWAFQLLIPSMRARKVDWFLHEYEACVAGLKTKPSIIAHSFGTYIVVNALLKYQEITFDRLILCGSIVQRDFDWHRLFDSGQGNAVLNEYGSRDVWVKLARRVVADAGASGTKGFSDSDPALYQIQRPQFRHSDFFFPLNYKKNWIPFLRGVEPGANASQDVLTRSWRFWLIWCFRLLCIAGVAIILLIIFRDRRY